jgi:Tfp pilus assembly protein PilF
MRCFRWLVLIPGLLLAASAAAQESETAARIPAPVATEDRGQTDSIEKLLIDLKRQRDPDTAQGIAGRIFTLWNRSDSATINLLMQWADEAIEAKRNAAALDFLDQAITLKPDFAGAWNKRATLHFTMGAYRKSMSDIQQVLSLEPRHFGALAGMAAILGETGRDEAALKAWERYLQIYPSDRQAQEVVTKLSEKLAGSRI